MNRLALLLLLFALPALAAQTGYRIVHPDGSVEYTDEPPAESGATEIPLPDIQTYEAPPLPQGEPPETVEPDQDNSDTVEYQRLEVTRPNPEEHIWTADWQVPVGLTLSPALVRGHQIVVTIDGTEVARGRSTRFIASPVYRGEHQVLARVLDEEGNVLIESDPLTFYIHKPQVNRP